jgi:hypothetical protein
MVRQRSHCGTVSPARSPRSTVAQRERAASRRASVSSAISRKACAITWREREARRAPYKGARGRAYQVGSLAFEDGEAAVALRHVVSYEIAALGGRAEGACCEQACFRVIGDEPEGVRNHVARAWCAAPTDFVAEGHGARRAPYKGERRSRASAGMVRDLALSSIHAAFPWAKAARAARSRGDARPLTKARRARRANEGRGSRESDRSPSSRARGGMRFRASARTCVRAAMTRSLRRALIAVIPGTDGFLASVLRGGSLRSLNRVAVSDRDP